MTQSVTLKLTVTNNVDAGDAGRSISMLPDYNDERNKEWSNYTPNAQLTMTVKNEVASDILKTGRSFLVTLTPDEESFTDRTFKAAHSARLDKGE